VAAREKSDLILVGDLVDARRRRIDQRAHGVRVRRSEVGDLQQEVEQRVLERLTRATDPAFADLW
jgi:hypothetical protein